MKSEQNRANISHMRMRSLLAIGETKPKETIQRMKSIMLIQKSSSNRMKKKSRGAYLQTTQPPISDSGAFTTRVSRIIIGLAIFEDSPAEAFLPGPDLSLQFVQCQSPSGMESRFKHTARQTNSL